MSGPFPEIVTILGGKSFISLKQWSDDQTRRMLMPETCHTMINAVQEQKNKNCCRKYLRALPRISSISVPCYTSHLPPQIQGDEPGSVDQHTGCLPSLPQSHPPAPVTDRKAAGDSEGVFIFYPTGSTPESWVSYRNLTRLRMISICT